MVISFLQAAFDHFFVGSVFGHEVVMGPLLRDFTLFEDDDFIGGLNGGEAVGDSDCCAAFFEAFESFLY